MNHLPSLPPQDPGFQLATPMDMAGGSPAPKFHLKKFLFFLKKFWWIPVITLILAMSAAVLDFRSLPPEYVSSGSMWETEKLELANGASFADDQDTYFGTMVNVLQSSGLRQQTLDSLAASGIKPPLGKDGNPLDVQISAYQQAKSAVFTIQGISSSAEFTPLYLNALMNSYLEYKKNVRKQVSGDTLASVSALIDRYGQEMKNDQQVLSQYEQSNNLVLLQQESTVAADELVKLKTQLADYQLESNMLDAVALERTTTLILGTTNLANSLFDQIQGGGNGPSPAAQSQDEYQQLEALKLERANLSRYLRPAHPKIEKLDEQITNAENLITFYRNQNQMGITTARQASKIRIDSVQKSIAQWEDKLDFDNSRLAQAENLKDNISRNQKVYDQLTSMMQNVDISRNIDQDPLAILQLAKDSTRSYAKMKSNMSTAAFGGLAVGVGIILFMAIRDDRFASVVEVSERIGDNVVGQVPEIKLRGGEPLALLGNQDERHMYVESYRNLRSALLYLAVDNVRPKLLLVTSAVPNEGKSTIASNLASAMAMGGARVLLIDGDLRKGRLHDILKLQSKPGFSDLLLQPEDLDSFIQASSMPNLSLIARGTILRNPGDLFFSNVIDSVLTKLRERYDYVIIDSCPVFAADDSTTLAPKVDATLFVVRSRFSRSRIVKEALDLLRQRQAVVLGLVLNRTDASGRSYHYYNYSEYHHSSEETA